MKILELRTQYLNKLIPSIFMGLLFFIVLASSAYSQDRKPSYLKDPSTCTGHVRSVSPAERTITIDDRSYRLSDSLVVRDKKDQIMQNYNIAYLNFVDLIEFKRSGEVIKEIKILRYTS